MTDADSSGNAIVHHLIPHPRRETMPNFDLRYLGGLPGGLGELARIRKVRHLNTLCHQIFSPIDCTNILVLVIQVNDFDHGFFQCIFNGNVRESSEGLLEGGCGHGVLEVGCASAH